MPLRRAAFAIGAVSTLLAALASASAAQEGVARVRGVVLDSASERTLPDALVLLDARAEAVTDRRGRFDFRDVEPGELLVAVLTDRCRVAAVRLHLEGGEDARLTLRVGQARVAGEAAAATEAAESGRARGDAIRVVTDRELERFREPSVLDVLRRVAPGMVGTPPSQPGRRTSLRERSRTTLTGPTQPLVLLDGVRLGDLAALGDIDPMGLSRIEVLPGASAGWAYGHEGANGVIRMFTRRGGLDPQRHPLVDLCGFGEARAWR